MDTECLWISQLDKTRLRPTVLLPRNRHPCESAGSLFRCVVVERPDNKVFKVLLLLWVQILIAEESLLCMYICTYDVALKT